MSEFNHRGYRAKVDFDPDDMIFTGRVLGINDVVGFHGSSVEELVAAFREAVDDYLETCAKIGKKPEREYSGKVMIRVDPEVHAKAVMAAELEGKSLNQFSEEALRDRAEKVVG